jgi:hypothetical protein
VTGAHSAYALHNSHPTGDPPMTSRLHPQISRPRRKSAVEQTSDLLRAYLDNSPGPFATRDEKWEEDQPLSELLAGFIVPQPRAS